MSNRGKIIVIEGMDGAGKATQSEMLTAALLQKGEHVRKVSFPNYESPSSGAIQLYLKGEFKRHTEVEDILCSVRQFSTFYSVDRTATFMKEQPNGRTLLENYRNGLTIVCDRYTTSNILHQSSHLRSKAEIYDYIKWIEEIEYETLALPRPDIVFYLDVEPQTSLNNMGVRYKGENKHDIHESREHLERVYELSHYIRSITGWKTIKCDQDGQMKSIEEIHEEILKHIS